MMDVMSSDTETIILDVYPWAEPTDEQKRMFDALPPEEKRRLIDTAIEEGFTSPVSDKPMHDVIAEAKTELNQ